VQRGDRVAYLGLNDPNMLVTLFACARLGAVLVPLNYRLSAPELAFIVQDSAPHTLLADAEHRPTIESIRGELPVRRYIALEADAAPGWESLASAESACAATPPPPQAALAQNDVALIMYTSGTTGKPKGAMLTHGNFWRNNINAQNALGLCNADVVLNYSPLFHVGGLCGVTLPSLQAGGHVVIQQRWDAGAVLEAIPQHRVTVSTAVPSMLLFLSQHPGFEAADLSSLRCLSVGGSPMPEPLMALYESRGIPVIQGFGMTETTSTVSLLTADRARDKLGSSATGVLLCEIRLADFEGRAITEPNVKGELCARGGNVMLGYWQRPEATAAAFDAEGWFHTGDVAYMDAEGFLYVCDRLKDMLISWGENVYPAEVESVLFQHPAIADAAVIVAPDEQWGERVVVVVSLKPGAELTLEALRAFARTQLAGYKIPCELRIVDALPRTSTGKVKETALRQQNPELPGR
jgi:fatty-acyl-CoA synthase